MKKNKLIISQHQFDKIFYFIFSKLQQVTSEELGSSLQDVNMLVKKNKTLKSEIENHEPRINFVRNNGQKLIDENNSQSEEFEQQIADLQEKLAHLKENLEARNVKLLMSEKVQQFFFDANEAEAWMSEQGNHKIDNYKVGKILKGSLDWISSPSTSVKINSNYGRESWLEV